MKLIMEQWRGYMLTEAAKGPEDLPDNIYVTIREGESITVHYADYLGRRLVPDKGAGIYGYVEIESYNKEPCLGAYMVIGSLATRGWGPMLYDLAMEYASKNGSGLMSDRQGVSEEAYLVWKRYYH